jgi:hypothetical protein
MVKQTVGLPIVKTELQKIDIKYVYLLQHTYCLISISNRMPEREVGLSQQVQSDNLTSVA